MNCIETKYVMPLYFSSELDVALMADFELHLTHCAVCAREAEQVRLYDDLLREAFVEQPLDTRELRARVRHQISTSGSKRSILFRPPRYLMTIAALVLLAICAGITYFALPYFSSESVYTSAADDHFEEVVQRAPLEGWRTTPFEIEGLVKAELGDQHITSRLAPAEYTLVRARVCDLAGGRYVHLVYGSEKREISIYVKHKGSELPGAVLETVNRCPVHAESTGRLEVAGFQSEKFTVLIVSDLPRTENLRLARESAGHVA
jgi:anti-sigma factor RsiW